MNILTIPVRNTRRKWGKTMLLLLVFSLGVASIVALEYVSKAVGESLEKKLTAFGANILVTPKSEALTVSYGGFSMGDLHFDVTYLDEQAVDERARIMELGERISAVAPKLVVMEQIGGKSVGVIGVRFKDEQAIKSYWGVRGEYPDQPGEALAGSKAAASLGLEPGTAIEIHGKPFTVSGVLMETGGDDDNVVLVSLPILQQLAGKPGKASFVEVSALCAGCPIDDIVAQLQAGLPNAEIKALRNIVKQRMYSVEFVQKLILTVSLVILLTACAMVGLSMLSSVNERKKEIGILRSLGYSRGSVFAIFLAEALFIGVLAGIAGYGSGFGLSFKILGALDVADTSGLIFRPAHFALTTVLICAVTAVSSLIPAWKASRVEPSQALITL